jgi:hypothetical protein
VTVLLVVAAVVVGAPLGAAVLVTVASHREDATHTLAGRPPGPFAAAARRLLCLRIGGTAYPRAAYPRRSAYPRRLARGHPPTPGPTAEPPPAELPHDRGRTLTLPRR